MTSSAEICLRLVTPVLDSYCLVYQFHAGVVLQGSATLLTASQTLKIDGRSKTGRQELIKACQLILEGTTKMLDVYDDSEVRKIVKMCDNAIQSTQQLKSIKDPNTLVTHFTSSNQAMIDLVAVAGKRTEEIIYAALKNRLKDATDELASQSKLIVSACQVVLQNPTNEHASQARAACCDTIIQCSNEIKTVVQIREWSEQSRKDNNHVDPSPQVAIQHNLAGVMAAVQGNNAFALDRHLGALNESTTKFNKSSASVAKSTRQEAPAKELDAKLKELEQVKTEIKSAAKTAIAEPANLTKQESLYKLLQKEAGLAESIDDLSKKIVTADLRDAAVQTKDHKAEGTAINKFYTAAKKGDTKALSVATAEFKNEGDRLNETLVHTAAILSPDEETAGTIDQTRKDIKGLMSQVVATGSAVAVNSKDPTLTQHLDNVVQAWENKVGKIESVVHNNEKIVPTHDVVSSDAMALESRYNNLSVPSIDSGAMEKALMGVVATIDRLSVTAQREIDNTSDPVYKSKLTTQLGVLKGCHSNAYRLHQQLKANPNDNKVINARARSTSRPPPVIIPSPVLRTTGLLRDDNGKPISRAGSHTSVLGVNSGNPGGALPPVIEIINGEEVEVIDDQPPEELSPEEAQENPIRAAANALKITASKYSAYNNPMVEVSRLMARKMESVSSLYKTNTSQSKQDLMSNAKSLHSDVSHLVKNAHKMLERCSDKTLQNQIMQSIERMETLSTQLRIVTAVKIAEARDTDSEKQLVLCSQSLMAAVNTALKACEVASLRQMTTAANATTAAIKFRKTLYKRSPRSSDPSPVPMFKKLSNPNLSVPDTLKSVALALKK